MNVATLPSGTPLAFLPPETSAFDAKPTAPVRTTGDLLSILSEKPPRTLPMMRTACGLLGKYLELPGDQIPIDLIEDRKRGFRPFLESHRYKENSVRSYVFQQTHLLKTAKRFGWRPDCHLTDEWKPVFELAARAHLTDIARHFSRSTDSPSEVTEKAVDQWGEARVREGLKFFTVAAKKNSFLRLLQKVGALKSTPARLLRFEKFGVPLEDLSAGLSQDIKTVLKWKQAPFAKNRPKFGKIRAVTANNDRLILTQIAGYVINDRGDSPQSLSDLLQQDYLEGFIEWAMNERRVKGRSIQGRLAGILAIVKHHPMFAGKDYTWFKALIDSIPIEDESEIKKRKASKYVSYEELEAIPARIRQFRDAYARKRNRRSIRVAQLAMEELIFRWFIVFPWRQRNLRECRVAGPAPNLFKAKIPPITEIDRACYEVHASCLNILAIMRQAKLT